MGLAGAMLPVAVKERFPDRPGFATGVYTSGMTVGSALAAASAVPLADLGSGWRTPLLVFGVISLALAALWLVLTRTEPRHDRVEARPLRLPLRDPLAWRLVAAFFLMSSVFYGLNSWLPDIYVERGWSESNAGALLAVMNTLTIPTGFAVAWAADNWGERRVWLAGAAALQLVALGGVLAFPDAGWLWAVILGIAIGPLFPLTMTLPLDASHRPSEVASLAGMMLGVGYTLSALSPLVLGAIRDLTGGFTAVLWTLVAVAALLVVVDASVSPARLARRRLAAQGST
jgi:CP family cyanate transporter-like MFS transporter